LYDIIHRRAPRAKKGTAVLAAVPNESQDIEDQVLALKVFHSSRS
jgi:hypothetical protein